MGKWVDAWVSGRWLWEEESTALLWVSTAILPNGW